MSDSEARKKAAEARRQRILQKGSDRLSKITTSGRGEEAKLFDSASRLGQAIHKLRKREASTPAQRNAAQQSRLAQQVSQQVRAARSASDDPDDVDIATMAPAGMPNNAMQRLMQDSSFADRFTGTESPQLGTPNSMNDLFAQMMGGGAQGPGGQANPMLAQMMAQMGGQQANAQPQIVRERTWLDRLMPVFHIVTMLAIAIYAVLVIEPTKRAEQVNLQRALDVFADKGIDGVTQSASGFTWSTWAKLAGEGGVRGPGQKFWNTVLAGGLAEVPLFYIFLVAELLLQSTQLLLTRNQIPPPSMLNTILPYLPPKLGMYASTGIKWWALAGTVIDDFAVLVLCIGLLVLLAEWRSGA